MCVHTIYKAARYGRTEGKKGAAFFTRSEQELFMNVDEDNKEITTKKKGHQQRKSCLLDCGNTVERFVVYIIRLCGTCWGPYSAMGQACVWKARVSASESDRV